ncbi:hypothetical protein AJ80_03283 [Polytolypa hystricis UAMH7299]|uniref:2EXR domain-containing protein n=1 Tax=Polytolypa hystricis (strain UAMH7299) TaxID=1447883 RepID=A0A2B7YIJ4_POLH7|nr:hypothetical protein AJ80_03283 [Polytolypa hystricis UAMH7299]
MAKRGYPSTLSKIEEILGYPVDSRFGSEDGERFYSNLSRVPEDTYDKAIRELKEHNKKPSSESSGSVLNFDATIANGKDTIIIKQTRQKGYYIAAVDINYGFGLQLPLQLSKSEAYRTLSVSKLKINETHTISSKFFNLPREIRDKIYAFAIPSGEWRIANVETFNETNFVTGIGDPNGFYFPLSKALTLLTVNKQMRQEALPIAYRKTAFRLDDMDEFIKVAIAIGTLGRENIESLEFAWESRADAKIASEEASDSGDYSPKLPTLHSLRCVQLLQQCKRLKSLYLYFERDIISDMSPELFKADPTIYELCSSIRGVNTVVIRGLNFESLEEYEVVQWLKDNMQSPVK